MTCWASGDGWSCSLRAYAKGLCRTHYYQERRRGWVGPIRSVRPPGSRAWRDSDGRKHCPGCDAWLNESDFGLSSRASDGRQRHCRSCSRDLNRLYRYGVSPERFAELTRSAAGACSACGKSPNGPLFIDHDHACCPGQATCGRCIRGLLCNGCNQALGFAQDSPDILRALAQYLEGAPRRHGDALIAAIKGES